MMTARPTCFRCHRPRSHCYCAHVPTLSSRTEIVFVQHPREADMPVGTARMAHLSLPSSTLIEGVRIDAHPRMQELFARPSDVAVLFPSARSEPESAWMVRPPKTLVVIDGTWSQAKKILKLNPQMASLRQLHFTPEKPGNYRIRKEPTDQHVSTIEAVSLMLERLENNPVFQRMLEPFDWMVDRQIDHIGKEHPSRHIKRVRDPRAPPLPRYRSLHRCLSPAVVDSAILVYAEGNGLPWQHRRRDVAAELVHLVAVHPASLQTFEAVVAPVAPRRPPEAHLPNHLELDLGTLLDGAGPNAVIDAFQRFVDDLGGSHLAIWGEHTQRLVENDGFSVSPWLDLRPLAADVFHHQAGGVDVGAAELGTIAGTTATPFAVPAGRAGRRLEALSSAWASLVTLARQTD
jgi:DTW domain-containing protein